MSELVSLLEEFGPLTAAAAGAAAAILLVCGLPWRAPRPILVAAGWVLAVGAGVGVGCWLLNVPLAWPPRQDKDRLLLVVFPAVTLVELLVAAIPSLPRWSVWLLRLALAFAAARILLHNSSYFENLAGPDSREWTPAQAWQILAALGAALAVVWFLLDLLGTRAPGRVVPLALALTAAAAGLTIMLSGYATGGPMAFPLTGALIGAGLASLLLRGAPDASGAIGVGVICLYSLLIIGRFFGELTTLHAGLLLAAPLLCWVPELPYVRAAPIWLNRPAQIVLVAIPLLLVLAQAREQFIRDSQPTPIDTGSGEIPEATIDDYRNFGK